MSHMHAWSNSRHEDISVSSKHIPGGGAEKNVFFLGGGGGGAPVPPSPPPHKTTTGSKAGSGTPLCLAMCLASGQEVTKLSPFVFYSAALGS